MFGDMMGMMGKLKETQKKVEETKERLNKIMIDESSTNNEVQVTITANRRIKSSRSVKFRMYHVATPRIEQAAIMSHHPPGMHCAAPSPSLGCRLKTGLCFESKDGLYRRNDAPTLRVQQNRGGVGPLFTSVWDGN